MSIDTQNSKAALPGQLQVSRTAYASYFGTSGAHRLALLLTSFLPIGLARRLGFHPRRIPHWRDVAEHCRHGCLGPGRIIDIRRNLIAVFTNLNARGERTIPAVKILKAPLSLLPPKLQTNSSPLVCISSFQATAESWENGYWSNFTPYPIHCLVKDEGACLAAQMRISSLAWKALDLALDQIPQDAPAGLHFVDVPHEIVWNAF